MSTNEIALTDLVRQLVSEKHEANELSKWIRGIVKGDKNKKGREDFEDRFIVEYHGYNRRPEKLMMVNNREARIFVENLCILKPYMSLFGRETSDSKKFPAYQQLKLCDKNNLLIEAQKLKDRLDLEKRINEDALRALPKFVAVLRSNHSIDITTTSLKEMMEQAHVSDELIDFSKLFQIAAWNDLSVLKAQLREEGETSETYRKIAEKILELGDEEGALDALDSATAISPDDGIAWALKAKIYLCT
jgi:tetratricopeptide (TPR) repeat protein